MAISLGIFSSFMPAQKVTFRKSSSYSFSSAVTKLVPANLRLSRSATVSASFNPELDPTEPPRRVSPEMKEFLGGASEIPGHQLIDEVFAYIEKNNLQDPGDWRFIKCDEKLQKIFQGKDRVLFLEIPLLMEKHFLS